MYHLRDWWCPLCLATSVHYVVKPDRSAMRSTSPLAAPRSVSASPSRGSSASTWSSRGAIATAPGSPFSTASGRESALPSKPGWRPRTSAMTVDSAIRWLRSAPQLFVDNRSCESEPDDPGVRCCRHGGGRGLGDCAGDRVPVRPATAWQRQQPVHGGSSGFLPRSGGLSRHAHWPVRVQGGR